LVHVEAFGAAPFAESKLMKILLALIAVFFFISAASAQSRTISKAQYEKVFQFAVSKTNDAYPVIFKVTTNFIENGRIIRRVTDLNENQSLVHYRLKRTIFAEGRRTNKYQVSVGVDNIFCSDDGVSWKPSKHQCFGPVSVYGRRESESVKYSVIAKWVRGKRGKVYREYSVFGPLGENEKKDFRETVSTIDSRGFFRTVVDTEGTLNPKKVTLRRKQSWVTKARIKPVVPPTERTLDRSNGKNLSSRPNSPFVISYDLQAAAASRSTRVSSSAG
jgi:hypothetical protein